MIFRDQGAPLHYQLETVLRRKILSGELERDARLPTQDELVEQYQVSRATVREAISALERDGLVYCMRGKGTFVLGKSYDIQFSRLTGSVSDLIARGIKVQTRVLGFRWTHALRSITDHLGLARGTKVLYIERLRLAKGRPLAYVINYLPPDIGRKIHRRELVNKPLLRILEDDLGIELTRADQKIEADIADTYLAGLMGIRVGDPLLKTERLTFGVGHTAIEYVLIWYRADRYFYTVRLDGKRAG
jgi:GntR family transcriptional regulator